MITFDCPHCNKKHRSPEAQAGKSGTCNGCGQRIRVPMSEVQKLTEEAEQIPIQPDPLEDEYQLDFGDGHVSDDAQAIALPDVPQLPNEPPAQPVLHADSLSDPPTPAPDIQLNIGRQATLRGWLREHAVSLMLVAHLITFIALVRSEVNAASDRRTALGRIEAVRKTLVARQIIADALRLERTEYCHVLHPDDDMAAIGIGPTLEVQCFRPKLDKEMMETISQTWVRVCLGTVIFKDAADGSEIK